MDVATSIVIERPREAVAAYSADPNNVPAWYVNIQSVEWQTEPRVALGSKIAFVAHFLGKRLEYVYEVVEYAQGEKLVMRTASGPFPMETTYVWESLGPNSTRMTLRNRGRPAGFSKIFAPFMGLMVRRATRKDLTRLKQTLEAAR